jgi:hypothetical protein
MTDLNHLHGAPFTFEKAKAEIKLLRDALEAHEKHMAAGQTLAVKYLVPVVDPDSIEKDDFVSRIIEHFDGPDQRAVQAKARAALVDLQEPPK